MFGIRNDESAIVVEGRRRLFERYAVLAPIPLALPLVPVERRSATPRHYNYNVVVSNQRNAGRRREPSRRFTAPGTGRGREVYRENHGPRSGPKHSAPAFGEHLRHAMASRAQA